MIPEVNRVPCMLLMNVVPLLLVRLTAPPGLVRFLPRVLLCSLLREDSV